MTATTNTSEYNGWKNRQTWNVALWIGNEEWLYREAVAYMQRRASKGRTGTYMGFIRTAGLAGNRTPDNIAWDGTRLCLRELNEMMKELA